MHVRIASPPGVTTSCQFVVDRKLLKSRSGPSRWQGYGPGARSGLSRTTRHPELYGPQWTVLPVALGTPDARIVQTALPFLLYIATSVPQFPSHSGGVATAANLELARTLHARGYAKAGLEAVTRRPYASGLWGLFGFHVDSVREEARLRADAGDHGGALALYDRLLRLRPEPPDLPASRQTWEAVRAEREALLSAHRG